MALSDTPPAGEKLAPGDGLAYKRNMIRNGPLVKRDGPGWRRLWPFGASGNRRVNTPVRRQQVARTARAGASERTAPASTPDVPAYIDDGPTAPNPAGAPPPWSTECGEAASPDAIDALTMPTAPSRLRPAPRQGLYRALGLVATLAALAGCVLGGRYLITHSRHFAVRELRLTPTRHLDGDAVRARTGVALGDNLFTVDLPAIVQELSADPWARRVSARRELPGTIAIDIEEREPACVVALGALYLADAGGEVFKRASVDEAAALPVVTGVPRDGYIDDRDASQTLLREALGALALWREGGRRPPAGEVHIDAATGVTLYTVQDGVGVRLGRGAPDVLRQRLRRLDQVWRSLVASRERPRMFLVDQRAHPERVTVRLAPGG